MELSNTDVDILLYLVVLQGYGLPIYATDLPGFDKPQWFFGCDRLELFAHSIGVMFVLSLRLRVVDNY